MISASGQQAYNRPNLNSATAVEKIAVGGNMQGNITVGSENVVGNYNIVYHIHTKQGAVVNLIEAQPPVRPRMMRGQPLSPPPDFVGRESELEQIREAIQGRKPLLVYGLDGIGKTALLAQASHSDAARAMPDGVVSVEGIDEAGKLLGLDDVVQRLFDTLFESSPPLKVTFPTARVHLSNTQPLLILDPLNLPVEALNRLPNLFPLGALLVTSQEAPIDNRYRFLPVRPLARGESLQLFSNNSGIPLDKTTQAYMNEICELLWDVPLAIVKTAVTIRRRNLALETVPPTLAAIQPSSRNKIQAAIERSLLWMKAILDERAQDMLALVAAAPGNSVDRRWLENRAKGEETSQELESLELLYANSPRLRLPAGMGQALQSSRMDITALREDLLHHLLHELESRPRDLEFVGAELGNLLGLLQWTSEQGRWPDVVTLGKAVDPYLTLHGLWDAWKWVLQQVLVAGQNLKDLAVRGWALHQLGTREIGVGTLDQAIRLLKRALRIRLSQGDVVGAAYTLHNLKLLLPPGTDRGQDGNDSSEKHTRTNGGDFAERPFWERWWGFLSRHFWIVGAAVTTAVIVAAILLPSLHMSVQASPIAYNPPGQVIEYSYRVDNAGLRKLRGPIFVTTQDGIRVDCPDLDTVGNGDDFLDWNEVITCSGFYKITATDVQNGSLKHTAVAGASEDGPHSRPASIVLRRGDRYLLLRIETHPTNYRSAGEIISVAYFVNGVGKEPLGGRISVEGETLQADCPDIQKVGNGDGFLDLGERLACTARYTITDADVQAGQWKTTAAVSIGNFKSDPQSITIFRVVPPALVLKKLAQPETYQEIGQQIHYTYEVTNQGGQALNGLVEVFDNQVDVTCAEQNDVLEPGETRTCQAVYTISAADLKTGSVTNTATAMIGNVESEPQSVTVVRAPPAHLVLQKSARPQTYQSSGQQFRYTYEVRNEGKDPIDGSVEVSDDRVEVTCEEQDGVLEPGELLLCSGVYVIDDADIDRGSLTNTARASAGSVQSPEASVTIPFEPVLPVLFKSSNTKTYYQVGETIEYTYVIQNPGGLPAGVSVYVKDDKVGVDCTQLNLAGNQSSAFAVGETMTCTGMYTIKAEDIRNKSVTNTAWAVLGNRTSEPKSVTIYYDPEPSKLFLKKTAEPGTYQQEGQQIQYMYFITNEGKYALKGQVRVEDGKTQVNCPSLRGIGDGDEVFDPGEHLTCTGTYLITKTDIDTGSVTNNARARVGDIYSNWDSFTLLEKAVRLEMAADPPGYQAVDDPIQYSYTVTGRNRAPLPSPAMISDDRVQQDTCMPFNQLGNGDDFLDWEEEVTCTGSYTITQADIDPPDLNTDHGSLTNTAVASVGGVQSEPSSLTIQGPKPLHNLLLEKAAAPGEYDMLGQAITYTYQISNAGNMTLFAPFTVTDDHIDNGASFPCEGDTRRLAPGESITCSREYQIAQTDFNFGNSSVTNQAVATGQFQEKTVESSTVSATIACPYPPEGWVPYQVEAGETLDHISTWYPNTPVTELQRLNCMGASTAVAEQTLYLPGTPPPAVLTGYVFADPNRNLFQDAGEERVVGVPVTIRNEAGSVAGRTITDGNGWYSFSNLGSGTYFVFQYRIELLRGEPLVRSFGIAPSLR